MGKNFKYIDINLRLKTANYLVTRVSKAEARLVCKTCRDGTESEVKTQDSRAQQFKNINVTFDYKV